jgi:hypothetical protein
MYRARQTDAEQNRPHYADPISCPVLAVGAQAYLGDEVSKQLKHVARDVRGAVIPAAGRLTSGFSHVTQRHADHPGAGPYQE